MYFGQKMSDVGLQRGLGVGRGGGLGAGGLGGGWLVGGGWVGGWWGGSWGGLVGWGGEAGRGVWGNSAAGGKTVAGKYFRGRGAKTLDPKGDAHNNSQESYFVNPKNECVCKNLRP